MATHPKEAAPAAVKAIEAAPHSRGRSDPPPPSERGRLEASASTGERGRSDPPAGERALSPTFRRTMTLVSLFAAIGLAYLLRGVLVPLFFAFLLAYALDPFVDWFEARRVPRMLGAPLVMLAICGVFVLIALYAIPRFVEEVRDAAAHLPDQLKRLEERIEPWLWQNFKFKPPHSMSEFGTQIGDKFKN